MPGKQMAIDADLNAGLIGEPEARARRKEVGQEAEFYGAMDGASKYVRGDAIAGIIVTIVNIVGGLVVGWCSMIWRSTWRSRTTPCWPLVTAWWRRFRR